MSVVTLVVTAAPQSLRGELTRWFLEVAPGVYVGRVSQRVREQLWLLVQDHIENGRALLTYTDDSEQGFGFQVLGHDRNPVEYDGLTLIRQAKGVADKKPYAGSRFGSEAWGVGSRRRSFQGKYR